MIFPFDVALVTAFHGIVAGSSILSAVAIFCAHYLPFLTAFLSVFLILSHESRAARFIVVYGGIAVAMVVLLALQIIIGRQRPFEAVSGVKSLIGWPLGASFPSGHAMFFSALASGMYVGNKELGLLFACLALVIGVSRIAVGVHWPTDIIAGLILGWLVAGVSHTAFFQKL